MTLIRKFWLYVAVSLVVLAIFVASAIAARGTQGKAMLERPQLVDALITPLYDDTGKMTSLHVTSKFKVLMLMPNGRDQVWRIKTSEFDLVQQGGQTIVLGQQSVEFADIGADWIGVTDFVWDSQNPPMTTDANHPKPLPQHPVVRRQLREPLTAK